MMELVARLESQRGQEQRVVHLYLADHEMSLVSRSQAKRILRCLEGCKEVVFNFEGVEIIGQGFADEIFRVWAKAHPEVWIAQINAVPAVLSMIERARRQRAD